MNVNYAAVERQDTERRPNHLVNDAQGVSVLPFWTHPRYLCPIKLLSHPGALRSSYNVYNTSRKLAYNNNLTPKC